MPAMERPRPRTRGRRRRGARHRPAGRGGSSRRSRRLESLALAVDGHGRVVDVDETPGAVDLAIDLRLAAVCFQWLAVRAQPGGEVPVELGPGRLAVAVDLDVLDAEPP